MNDPNAPAWVTAALTAILVFITLVYVLATIRIQESTSKQVEIQSKALDLQNRLCQAQLLTQRYDMYCQTQSPITDSKLQEVDSFPDDYMDPNRYEEVYKHNPEKLRRYVYLAVWYEYLAFTFTMRGLSIPDPIGYEWTELWATELSMHDEFQEVNDWYRKYYPAFSGFVDKMIHNQNSTKSSVADGFSDVPQAT